MIKNSFFSGNIPPNCPNAWDKLKSHHKELSKKSLSELFSSQKNREKDLSLEWEDFFIDFSKNRINSVTIDLLNDLVNELNLGENINALFSGSKINETENRSVLHTALRSKKKDPLLVDGDNIMSAVEQNKQRMYSLAKKITDSFKKIDLILSPAIGGIVIGYEIGKILNIETIFAERVNEKFILRPYLLRRHMSYIVNSMNNSRSLLIENRREA